jgi:hypothetical protein
MGEANKYFGVFSLPNWVLITQTEYDILYFEGVLLAIEGTNCLRV